VVKSKPEVIASVNGENISKDEFYDALVKSNGDQVLDSLISQKIVELESVKQNIVISDADIQKEIDKYYQDYGGEEGFTQALATSGYTLDKVKKDIVNNLEVKKLLGPQISVTEEEMKAYFEENKASLAQSGQAANYEQSKAAINDTLLEKKIGDEYANWMQQLYQQYNVQNFLITK
jgi:foldase protein PrsA